LGKSNSIDFSSFEHPEIITELFSVFKGKIISLEKFHQEFLISTILFVEIEPLKDFISFSFEDFSSFSTSTIKQIFSSPFLHLINENQLFEFVLNQIKLDQTTLYLIQYLYYGLFDHNSFLSLLSSFEFSEISF
jgi:hypothetical protein